MAAGYPPVYGTAYTAGSAASGTASFTLTVGQPAPGPAPAPPGWHFIIAAPQPDGTHLAEIVQAQARTLTVRAGPGGYSEAGADVSGRDLVAAAVTELETDLQVIRGGDILFCGRFGAAQDTLDGTQHRFTPAALDYREVLRRRSLAYGGGPPYTNTDVADIAWGLIRPDAVNGFSGVQGYPGGDLGIARGAGRGGTGQLATINYVRQQFAGQEIDNLAQSGPGFDWDITPYAQADLRLDIWPPGGRGQDRGVVLEYGGSLVSSVTRSADPAAYANSVFVTGTAPDGTPLSSTGVPAASSGAVDASDIASRPEGRWDQVIGTQRTSQDGVDSAAAWYLQDGQASRPSYTITLVPGAWQGPDHIWLGDLVTVRIDSGRLAVDDKLPVTEMAFTISPDDTETLVLTAGRIPFRLRQSIPRTLRRLRGLESR